MQTRNLTLTTGAATLMVAALLLGLLLDAVALKVSGASVVLSGFGTLTVSGELAVASVSASGAASAAYSALKMGEVQVALTAGTPAIGLSGALTIARLDANNVTAAGAGRLNWARAFDLDGDGTKDILDPGARLPEPAALPIDFASSLQLLVSGTVTGTPLLTADAPPAR